MHVLVIGGTGFIGRHVTGELMRAGGKHGAALGGRRAFFPCRGRSSDRPWPT
jgi:uncharacterized protein YbjT (DUF2867 family)